MQQKLQVLILCYNKFMPDLAKSLSQESDSD